MWQAVTAVALRDLLLALRLRTDLLTIAFFFAIVVSLFPLGVGADPAMLRSDSNRRKSKRPAPQRMFCAPRA